MKSPVLFMPVPVPSIVLSCPVLNDIVSPPDAADISPIQRRQPAVMNNGDRTLAAVAPVSLKE